MRIRHLPYDLFSKRCCGLLLSFIQGACVQSYVSPYKSPPTGYLVVEGFISGNTATQFSLSRSIELPGDSAIPVVSGAQVQVEGSDSSVYPLPEEPGPGGNYGGSVLALNPAVQYRLRINTADGQRYLSDFVPLKQSPPIDSVNWTYSYSNGVDIYVNTHDPANATRYYRWTYVQTWEHDAALHSYFVYDPTDTTVSPRTAANQVFRCWTVETSTNVVITSTAKLSQDLVSALRLVHIPPKSQQLGILYSIEVTQFALTQDAYNFYGRLLVNTESLGSIFDAQPTELTGNIHCLSNAGQQVIGYVAAGITSQQRLYIYYDQLPYWEYLNDCPSPTILIPDSPDTLVYYFVENGYTPLYQTGTGAITTNFSFCADCTFAGGTNQKPPFWPN